MRKLGDRITPAYTGKTQRISSAFSQSQDHPRVYGENEKLEGWENDGCGSPPRIRGKLTSLILSHARHRITPAYTGKTPDACGLFIFPEDHPRVYGENHMTYI